MEFTFRIDCMTQDIHLTAIQDKAKLERKFNMFVSARIRIGSWNHSK